MRRVVLSPGWLGRHLLLVCCLTAFALLGRWQWDVSASRTGSIQNTIYAFQWWSFGLIFIYGWWRMLREDLRGGDPADIPAAEPAPAVDEPWVPATLKRRARPVQPDDAGDDELAAYNAYLARLHARDAARSRTARPVS